MIEPLPKMEAWHDFYVMTGSGAAALTGLLFVIVTLAPHIVARSVDTGVRSFISPIAVHFTAAMTVSAVMLAPDIPAMVLGGGLAAAGRNAGRSPDHRPPSGPYVEPSRRQRHRTPGRQVGITTGVVRPGRQTIG